jgi:putative addiction module CopG family antidote
MEITLTPEIEKLLKQELETGDYVSSNDVLREGLLLLRAKKLSAEERLEKLKSEINKGRDAVKNGKYREYDSADEMIEDVIKEARAEFEVKQK